MRDLVFVALVLGFFALAALFVRGCELLLGPATDAPPEGGR